MQEQELRYCPLTKYLTMMDADHPRAEIYLKSDNADRFAEVTDMYRLHDLLHRSEYRPVAAIRFHRHGEHFVRVYFQQLHVTSFETGAEERVSGHQSHAVLTGAISGTSR